MHGLPVRKMLPLLLLVAIAGCGGSSTSEPLPSGNTPPPSGNTPPPSGNTPPPSGGDPPPDTQPPPSGNQAPMTMFCVDGPEYQCSGATILRTDNGIAVTDSGVQAYGVSTSDLSANNPNLTTATGLQLASGGTAEVRLAKGQNGVVSNPGLLLRNLGLSWDGTSERPPIIETFNPTQGRVQLDASGRISFAPLPDSSDLAFYDYASLGPAGTQAHYANNRYFPREGNPSRCEPSTTSCPDTETIGIRNQAGNWRTGGNRTDWLTANIRPDRASAIRVHGDGDIHAGDGPPDANGNRTWLVGGNGIGVPFPGSKGYRSLANWGLQYANLSSWTTQDTILIEEWAALRNEHNKNRRGIVAFGDVTAPTLVPATGTVTYSGMAYGWYAANGTAEPEMYWGDVLISTNFATREVVVTIQNTVTHNEAATPVPAALTATVAIGPVAANTANYMTGTVDTGTLSGGLSGRYFGPVAASGSDGTGPAEVAGVFRLSNATSGQAVVGGFIALRQ